MLHCTTACISVIMVSEVKLDVFPVLLNVSNSCCGLFGSFSSWYVSQSTNSCSHSWWGLKSNSVMAEMTEKHPVGFCRQMTVIECPVGTADLTLCQSGGQGADHDGPDPPPHWFWMQLWELRVMLVRFGEVYSKETNLLPKIMFRLLRLKGVAPITLKVEHSFTIITMKH